MRLSVRIFGNFQGQLARYVEFHHRIERKRREVACRNSFGNTNTLLGLCGREGAVGSGGKLAGLAWPYQYLGLGMAVA